MSGFDDNPFGEPTIDNPFAVSYFLKKIRTVSIYNDPYVSEIFLIAKWMSILIWHIGNISHGFVLFVGPICAAGY